mgnify:CR=1 FL=1
MTSLSLSFHLRTIAMQQSNAFFKISASLLAAIQNDLRQRLVKQRFFKSVSLITGFEKTVLGCHSKGSSFGEQALAEYWYLELKK